MTPDAIRAQAARGADLRDQGRATEQEGLELIRDAVRKAQQHGAPTVTEIAKIAGVRREALYKLAD